MPYEIEWQALPEQPVLVIRAALQAEEIGTWLPQAHAELFGHLEKLDVPPAGPPYARYERNGHLVVEAGVPVTEPVEDGDPLVMSSLPSGTVATTTRVGGYGELTEAYEALQLWIIEQGYEPTGHYWEIYLPDPADPADPAHPAESAESAESAETAGPVRQRTVLFMQYR